MLPQPDHLDNVHMAPVCSTSPIGATHRDGCASSVTLLQGTTFIDALDAMDAIDAFDVIEAIEAIEAKEFTTNEWHPLRPQDLSMGPCTLQCA